MATVDEKLSGIREDIQEMKDDLHQIRQLLVGNGQVEDSVMFRLATAEQQIGRTRRIALWLGGTVGSIVISGLCYGLWQLLTMVVKS